jgi:hypothetical protein
VQAVATERIVFGIAVNIAQKRDQSSKDMHAVEAQWTGGLKPCCYYQQVLFGFSKTRRLLRQI